MALSSMLGSLFAGSGAGSVAGNYGSTKLSQLIGSTIEGANIKAEMEVGMAELNKIEAAKKNKIRQLKAEEMKDTMSVNEKSSSIIQF